MHFRDATVVCMCRKGSTSEYTVNKYGLVPCGHALGASSRISRTLDKPSVVVHPHRISPAINQAARDTYTRISPLKLGVC